MATSIVGLLIMFFLSLYFGAEKNINFVDIINSLFRFNDEIFNEVIVRNIRLPRFIADILVGASLAIAGALMQGTTKNPMADSGIMGISSGSVFWSSNNNDFLSKYFKIRKNWHLLFRGSYCNISNIWNCYDEQKRNDSR